MAFPQGVLPPPRQDPPNLRQYRVGGSLDAVPDFGYYADSMNELDARDAQPELFHELPPLPRRRTLALGLRSISLRQDHLVLGLILSLITGSIVFSFGVERGKQLARLERPLLDRAPSAGIESSATAEKPDAPAAPLTVPTQAVAPPVRRDTPSPARMVPARSPVKAKSRFAVRVVTYSQPKLAQLELQRLQQRGEQAFIVKQTSSVALYVGPFPTKQNASAKLGSLRKRYQDCFIQSL